MEVRNLIHQYLIGNLDSDGVHDLETQLANDAEFRKEFRLAAEIDSALRDTSIEHSIEVAQAKVTAFSAPNGLTLSGKATWLLATLAALAATVLFAGIFWSPRPTGVATLLSSENAAWESSLPTSPGSDLVPGSLHLKSGVATIRFHSGAEMVIEAPAQLELVSSMRAKLDSGAAVMEVSDSAKGFILETPGGYAIDYGTKFAVRVGDDRESSSYELIEGDVEVHHPASSNSVRLTKSGEVAAVSPNELLLMGPGEPDGPGDSLDNSRYEITRIETKGRCGTAMPRNHKRHKFIDSEHLLVKKSQSGVWDFRSFFDFDLSTVDRQAVVEARLRLNLVPSTRGLASRLPRINRFAVYGLTNLKKADWNIEPTWEHSPAPEDGILLGKFEIERSVRRGSFGIGTPELLAFVKRHSADRITLIVVRETGIAKGDVDGTGGVGMVHMFASDKHPESVGPLLELKIE